MDYEVKLNKMSDQLDRLETAIVGDEKFGAVGIVGRINNLEDQSISKSLAIKWSIGGLVSFIATIFAVLKLT